MRPATSKQADGPQNLADALSLVCEPQARGVLVVCAGEAHAALTVQKVHASRLNAFASHSGPMAVRENGAWVWANHQSSSNKKLDEAAIEKRALACLAHDTWPRVELVMSHAGATGAVVDALLSPSSAAPLAGLVVAATGNLTVHASLQAALDRAQEQGVVVQLATRCVWGGVVQSTADGFENVFNDLSPLKARIALMLQLMRN
jgi:L-asparaginase